MTTGLFYLLQSSSAERTKFGFRKGANGSFQGTGNIVGGRLKKMLNLNVNCYSCYFTNFLEFKNP